MRHPIVASGVAAVSLFVIGACAEGRVSDGSVPADYSVPADTDAEPSGGAVAAGNVDKVAAGNAQLSVFVSAVRTAGLVEMLQDDGPFTIFAPSNDAFAAMEPGVLEKLLLPHNKESLSKLVMAHIVPQRLRTADLEEGDYRSVNGAVLTVTTVGGLRVNEASVTYSEFEAKNGVVLIIDKVLMPTTLDVSSL